MKPAKATSVRLRDFETRPVKDPQPVGEASAVTFALASLNNSVLAFEEAILALQARLASVLPPEREEADKSKPETGTPIGVCSVARDIHECADRVTSLTNRVMVLYSNLQN